MHSCHCIFAALVYCLLFHKNQAYRNLVVRGLTTATQSSTYLSFSADRTIDGYPDKLGMRDGSCSHTGSGQTKAWLRIDLDKVYNVKEVRFWYRNDSCEANQYGENCTDCNAKCTDCDITRGCVSCQGKFTGSECDLCLPGYTGNNCERICTSGWYGQNCSMECSDNCLDNDTCFHVNECINGSYGLGCLENCSGNCFENQTCDFISGTCQNGCSKGWTGSKCFTSCSNSTYGENCRYNCSGHCFQNETCNRLEGYCPNGCEIGWDGEACGRACPEYSFGRDCLEKCGRCVNNTCNHVNGSCSRPCQDGWEGEGCLLAKDDLESPLKRSYSFLLEAVAGTGALVVIITVAAILIFWIRHKKTHFTGKKSAHADKKDLEQEMPQHPETSGIYENQDGFSSSAERRNSPTRELSNNLTARPMYEVLNQDERSTEEYDTLSNNPTDQPMYEVINKGERSTEEYDTLKL